MRLQGTVSSLEMFGILVDVGIGRDGLVHISELGETKGGDRKSTRLNSSH